MPTTLDDHLARCNELLDMALAVARDESMPVSERASELRRLLGRIEGHAASAEFLAEVEGR